MDQTKGIFSTAPGLDVESSSAETPPEPEGDGSGLRLAEIDGVLVPEAPSGLDDTGIDPEVLLNLALKLAYITPHFTTDSCAKALHLPLPMIADLLEQLRAEKLIEILGHLGPFNYRFRITQPGRERGEWLMAISGYVGPAPVSVQAYSSMLQQQAPRLPEASAQDVAAAIADLVLPEHATEIAGLATSSGRSLFLYGPPGNGKTSLGKLLHQALRGSLWIPHCLGIENHIIRVFDRHCHIDAPEDVPAEALPRYDRRWARIRRPFVMVGGELTLEDLDLIFDSARGYYEAPLHFKANGGLFLLDDFGCQRTPSSELLNRWIVPLEHHVDYLTLKTGQQIQVPFRHLLIISTNIDPEKVMTPGLMRRMGYRLCMANPSPEQYARIFDRYAAGRGIEVPPGLVERLLARYRAEGRALHSCEPRDLIERACDMCNYRGRPVELTEETLTIAWAGYFVDKEPDPPGIQ